MLLSPIVHRAVRHLGTTGSSTRIWQHEILSYLDQEDLDSVSLASKHLLQLAVPILLQTVFLGNFPDEQDNFQLCHTEMGDTLAHCRTIELSVSLFAAPGAEESDPERVTQHLASFTLLLQDLLQVYKLRKLILTFHRIAYGTIRSTPAKQLVKTLRDIGEASQEFLQVEAIFRTEGGRDGEVARAERSRLVASRLLRDMMQGNCKMVSLELENEMILSPKVQSGGHPVYDFSNLTRLALEDSNLPDSFWAGQEFGHVAQLELRYARYLPKENATMMSQIWSILQSVQRVQHLKIFQGGYEIGNTAAPPPPPPPPPSSLARSSVCILDSLLSLTIEDNVASPSTAFSHNPNISTLLQKIQAPKLALLSIDGEYILRTLPAHETLLSTNFPSLRCFRIYEGGRGVGAVIYPALKLDSLRIADLHSKCEQLRITLEGEIAQHDTGRNERFGYYLSEVDGARQRMSIMAPCLVSCFVALRAVISVCPQPARTPVIRCPVLRHLMLDNSTFVLPALLKGLEMPLLEILEFSICLFDGQAPELVLDEITRLLKEGCVSAPIISGQVCMDSAEYWDDPHSAPGIARRRLQEVTQELGMENRMEWCKRDRGFRPMPTRNDD